MRKKEKAQRAAKFPDAEEIKKELERERYWRRFRYTFRSTVNTLIVAAAITILIATTIMPVFRTYGDSMTPTLTEGDIVVSLKGSKFTTGDVVALYVGNKLLVKRVIAGPSQWVDIREDGTLFVDGKQIEEPYITEKALGDTDITYPYQVPDGRYFVMGDHRSTSLDSRNTAVGCIADEQIVGRIVFRVWPLTEAGPILKETSND